MNCTLAQGGSYLCPDPNLRGAVIKGMGIAKDISLKQGEVLNGRQYIDKSRIELQIDHHPPINT